MKRIKNGIKGLVLVFATFIMGALNAQELKNKELYEILKAKDSLLFNIGFNQCDISQFGKLTSENFEFYHDKGGTHNVKKSFITQLENGLCKSGKNTTPRELIENSMEVYPLYNEGVLYGAIQMGSHRFHKTIAKFTHLWMLENGSWKLSRVLSYNHQPAKAKMDSDIEIIHLPSEKLDMYVGQFQFSPNFTLEIVKEGDKLYGVAQGDKIEIQPYAMHKFLVITDNSKIEFILDDSGTVVSMSMIGKNGEMTAKKIG